MAISTLSPSGDVAPPDLVTLREASDLFSETGPDREASPRTLERWVSQHRRRTWRVRGRVCASWTDLLEIHAMEIDRREGTGQ